MGEPRNPSDPASQGPLAEDGDIKSVYPTLTSLAANTNVAAAPGRFDNDNINKSPTLRLKFRPLATGSAKICAAANDNGTGGGGVPWDAVMWRSRLYVSVSSQQLSEGSKDAFVSLLEYAEDNLRCSHVVICLDKSLGEKNLKSVVRNFLFLGFQPLAPGHELLPPMNQNLVIYFKKFSHLSVNKNKKVRQ